MERGDERGTKVAAWLGNAVAARRLAVLSAPALADVLVLGGGGLLWADPNGSVRIAKPVCRLSLRLWRANILN